MRKENNDKKIRKERAIIYVSAKSKDRKKIGGGRGREGRRRGRVNECKFSVNIAM